MPKHKSSEPKSWMWVLGNARTAQRALNMKIRPGPPFSARRVAKITILGCPATLRGPCGKGNTYFYKLFSENLKPDGFFALGPSTFYFLPLDLFLSLPERKFRMTFSQFPAAECGRGGKKIFLSCGGRPSSATPPGPRALCPVGLAAWFLFFAVHFSPGHRAPAPHPGLQAV